MLWRSVYVNEHGELVADGVRVPYLGETTARIGSTTPAGDAGKPATGSSG